MTAIGRCMRCGILANWEFELHSESCAVVYTIPGNVHNARKEDTPLNPYASGYGRKIPTRYFIKYESGKTYENSRWRRVYMMQYGNAGSAYILFRNKPLFLDSDTEYKLEKM